MKKLIFCLLFIIPFQVSASTIKYIKSDNNYIIIEDSLFEIKAKLNGSLDIQIENLNSYGDIFSSDNNDNYPIYLIKKDNKYSFSDFKKDADTIYIEQHHYMDISSILQNPNVENTCDGIFGYQLINLLKDNVFKLIYIAIPILLLVLSTLDFFKLIYEDSKEGLKGAFKNFGRRVIASVLIFLTPSVLLLLINIIGGDEVKSCVETFSNLETSDLEN